MFTSAHSRHYTSSHVLHRVKFLEVKFGHTNQRRVLVVKPKVNKTLYKRMESLKVLLSDFSWSSWSKLFSALYLRVRSLGLICCCSDMGLTFTCIALVTLLIRQCIANLTCNQTRVAIIIDFWVVIWVTFSFITCLQSALHAHACAPTILLPHCLHGASSFIPQSYTRQTIIIPVLGTRPMQNYKIKISHVIQNNAKPKRWGYAFSVVQ